MQRIQKDTNSWGRYDAQLAIELSPKSSNSTSRLSAYHAIGITSSLVGTVLLAVTIFRCCRRSANSPRQTTEAEATPQESKPLLQL